MNKFFPEIKKNFGFGCMRLPMKDGEVDYQEFIKALGNEKIRVYYFRTFEYGFKRTCGSGIKRNTGSVCRYDFYITILL